MIALPPWAYLALLLSVLAAALWVARSLLTKQSKRAALAFLAALAVLALAITLWIDSSNAPLVACEPMDGLSVHAQVDAQKDGYLLPARSGPRYLRHAVYDLVQGRIGFFEIEQSPDEFARYRLASVHNPSCIDRTLHDEHLAELPMPAGMCVAVAIHAQPIAGYRLEGYRAGQQPAPKIVSVKDRSNGRLLAQYRSPQGAWGLLPWRRTATCENQLQGSGHPLWNLSSFVFRDLRGKVFDATEYDKAQKELGATTVAIDLLPPTAWVRRQLAYDGQLARNACVLPGWSGETEVFELALDTGPLEMKARLDARSDTAGVVLLDVHVPDKAVVILARARGPTIWHIHESSRSSVVAVLVQAEHGQAVVGLTQYSRVLMSTRFHNPYANCSAAELQDIVNQVTKRHGISRRQSAAVPHSEAIVRYALGEPMPAGGELFHHERSMSDFELRAE